jgi:hypothetical protein
MAPPYIGPRAAIDILFGVGGISGADVINFQNRNGLTAEQIVQRAAAGLGAANELLFNRWSGISYFTQDMFARYRKGGGTATKTPEYTEYTKPDPIRGDESGHLLRYKDYRDALAWTTIYLRDAYESQIDADIQEIVDRWINRVDQEATNRLFDSSEYPYGSGYTVPFAIGDAGQSVPFIPPNNGAWTFDSTHTNYLRVNAAVSAANLKTGIDNGVQLVRKLGYTGRLAAWVSDTDVATWATVTGFHEVMPEGFSIVQGGSTELRVSTGVELQGVPGELFGYYKSARGLVELRYLERIPTGYLHVNKPLGTNNPRNPLAWRLHPSKPFGLMPKPTVTNHIHPELDAIEFEATYGVNINNRTNGVSVQVASGGTTYTDPTIS